MKVILRCDLRMCKFRETAQSYLEAKMKADEHKQTANHSVGIYVRPLDRKKYRQQKAAAEGGA